MAKTRHHRESQRVQDRAAAINSATDAARTRDSFTNFTARLGAGAGSQQDGAGFSFNFVSRNRIQMEAAYRGNWVCGMACDIVAEDMTRAGITINSDLEPDQLSRVHAAYEKLQLWQELGEVIKWARLYGGALGVLQIDGQDVSTPLNLKAIGKGQFKGLLVLDRWLVQPSLEMLVTQMGPDLGKPMYYTVVADAQALRNQKVHYSRVIRIDGVKLPYWQRIAENGWGQSVLERCWDRIIAFDSTTEGAAQLVYKAHLRTVKIKDLRTIIGAGGKAFDALIKNLEMIRQLQSNEGLTILDGEDEFEATQYTFTGLDEMMLQFAQQLSGALQIPMVRFFGQSPAGLNSTGESDIRTYEDNINRAQDKDLRPGITLLNEVVFRSEFGMAPPDDMNFIFNPLSQLSDAERAAVAKDVAAAVTQVEEAGIITRAVALQELKASSEVTGIFSNITDEQIQEAEDEPPPPTEMDMLEAQAQAKTAAGGSDAPN